MRLSLHFTLAETENHRLSLDAQSSLSPICGLVMDWTGPAGRYSNGPPQLCPPYGAQRGGRLLEEPRAGQFTGLMSNALLISGAVQ